MRAISIVVAFTLGAFAASAEEGIVVLERTPSCDEFIVETASGYTLIEWYGGVSTIFQDDRVYGELNSYGMKDIFIEGRGEMHVWIDDFMVGERKALDFFYEACG